MAFRDHKCHLGYVNRDWFLFLWIGSIHAKRWSQILGCFIKLIIPTEFKVPKDYDVLCILRLLLLLKPPLKTSSKSTPVQILSLVNKCLLLCNVQICLMKIQKVTEIQKRRVTSQLNQCWYRWKVPSQVTSPKIQKHHWRMENLLKRYFCTVTNHHICSKTCTIGLLQSQAFPWEAHTSAHAWRAQDVRFIAHLNKLKLVKKTFLPALAWSSAR